MITGIGHNALRVSDMEASVQFYCEVIGLKKAFTLEDEHNNPWIVYLQASKNQFLELFYDGKVDPERRYDADLIGYHHFCFEIEDLKAVGEKLVRLGFLKSASTSPGKDKNSGYWIHDPDGNAVELVCYSPESPHLTYGKAVQA